MVYKALMLDVDGTIVPYDFDALPSEKVVNAVRKAQEKVTVCLVTGREYGFIRDILSHLGMHAGYAVVNNGANVVDIASEALLYDQPIESAEAAYTIDVLHQAHIEFYIKDHFDNRSFLLSPFQKSQPPEKSYMFYIPENFPEEVIDDAMKKLHNLSHISLYKTHHKQPNKFGISITHTNATKLHGIEIIMQKLGLKKEEIIGVGDSYNDFPLLMASGLKVAMGNAVEELKAIADYIAHPVTEDGVAEVINKFVLAE